MRTITHVFFGFFIFFFASSLGSLTFAGEWEPNGKKDGVALFKKEIAGSPVVAFKGEGIVNSSLWKIASIFLDGRRAPEWVDSVVECKVIRQIGPKEYIEYNHVATPFILKDRDFVSRVQIESDPKSKTFLLKYKAAEDSLAPPTKYVRGEIVSSVISMKAQGDGSTFVIAEVHVDPKGSVPNWIVNMFQQNWAHNTFLALRARANRRDIDIPERFSAVLLPYRDTGSISSN